MPTGLKKFLVKLKIHIPVHREPLTVQRIGQAVSQNGSQVQLPVVVFEVVERGTDRGE